MVMNTQELNQSAFGLSITFVVLLLLEPWWSLACF